MDYIPWLHRQYGRPYANIEFNLDVRVCELIHPNGLDKDESVVRNIFVESAADKILRVL